MAVTVTKTVKSSGGDYSSLSAYEAGEQGNLVTADEVRQAECYAFQDTTQVNFSGWTTDATRYVRVYTPSAERHDGKYNTSRYRNEVTAGGNFFNLFENTALFARFEGLQFQLTAANRVACIGFYGNANGTSDVRLTECIIKGILTGTTTADGVLQAFVQSKSVTANCIAYDFDLTVSRGFRTEAAADDGAFVYNNTAQNCAAGFSTGFQDSIAKNNIAYSCSAGYSGTWGTGTSYNLSGPSTSDAPGTNGLNATTVTFVDAANDDFHLASGDTGAKDAGTDLSADGNYAFSIDIDGQTRSGTWDRGADEFVVTTTDTAFSFPASGVATFGGVSVATASFSIQSQAQLIMAASSIASADLSVAASAALAWGGADTGQTAENTDSLEAWRHIQREWPQERLRRRQFIDEQNALFLRTVELAMPHLAKAAFQRSIN